MGNLGVYVLLLLAVASGALLANYVPIGRRKNRRTHDIFDDYFVGLNYLLNDEPDEAIDTFIKALEVNNDTIETHLALGALLRRRGKVDKAIKVHQALLARPGLERDFSDSTRLQLAIDYISAGLLDRAERLLNEILNEDSPAKWAALRHLITIYQTEKEWEDAITCSSRLLSNSAYKRDLELRAAAAHYCCEQADVFLAQNQNNKAKEQAKRAFNFDRKNIRASLLLAKIEQRFGNQKAAIKELVRIRRQSPEFTGQILRPLSECFEQLQDMAGYEKLLRDFLEKHSDIHSVIALSHRIRSQSGDEAALAFLNAYVSQHPSLSGLIELLKVQIPRTDEGLAQNLQLLQHVVTSMQQKKASYRCHQCGYESRSLYWLCPSCQKWDKIRPIAEAE